MRDGDGRAHRTPFLQCPGEARLSLALGKRDDQDASIELGPDPLTSHHTRQPKLARKTTRGLEIIATVSEPGVVHQPAIACGGDGAVWTFWGQADARNIVTLRARRFADGKLDLPITLAASEGSDTFADAGTDRAGRVWAVWQSLRRGQGDIFAHV